MKTIATVAECHLELFHYSPSSRVTCSTHVVRCPFHARQQEHYCYGCVLAIAILSVCQSACHTGGSMQTRITGFSLLAARKNLVSESAKLFQKFEKGHLEQSDK